MTFANKHFPTMVGFDRILSELDNLVTQKHSGYPPHNVRRVGDKYYVEMATAGFKRSEIDVEVVDHHLKISANRKEEADKDQMYIHKGIGTRSFSNTFRIDDDLVVNGASYEDGILSVEMERIVPEERKARKITIGETLNVLSPQLLTEEGA